MPTRHTQLDRELSLAEMLADPIVQAVLARDGCHQGRNGRPDRRGPAQTGEPANRARPNEPSGTRRLGLRWMTETAKISNPV